MKTKFLLTITLLSNSFCSLLAQSTDLSYSQMADTLLYPVNKGYISTGILYDRVFPFASLYTFNGVSPDTSSHLHFIQSYKELYEASYNNTGMLREGYLDTLAKAIKYTDNVIPIGVLYYDFNLIDTNAVENNLLYRAADSMYYDVPGRPISPYWLKNVTVIAAMAPDALPYGNGNFQFRFYNDLFLNNKGVSINNLEADFGAGYQNITAGNSINIYYPTAGAKYIQFRITYSNGSQVITRSHIEIVANDSSTSGSLSNSSSSGARTMGTSSSSRFGAPVVWDDIFDVVDTQYGYQGYGEVVHKYNSGTWAVYYHRTSPGGPIERVIRKPVIILDGFDPLDERDQKVIYGNYLNYTQNNNLGDELRDQGYDVIILNFPTIPDGTISIGPFQYQRKRETGADFIQRNAFLLVTLIEHINQLLIANSSAAKLVVVGPSMGGLISRYALKWMEDNSKNHNTRLWVSFDSPHKGANIAIGDQHFLNFFAEKAGNKGARDARDKQINSSAAKQMLLHHYLKDVASGSRNNLPGGAPNFRNAWQQELDNLGFPNQLRRISVVNGSLNGTLLGTACEQVLEVSAHLSLKTFLGKTKGLRVGAAKIFFAGNYGSYCRVFDGWAKIWFNDGEWNAAAPNTSKSFDIIPGSYFSTQQEIADEGSGFKRFPWAQSVGTNTIFNVIKPSHSFIPTMSALAMNIIGVDLAQNLSDRNLVCTGETPFQSYHGDNTNYDHITFTPSNVTFLKNEINNQPAFITGIDMQFNITNDCYVPVDRYTAVGGGGAVNYKWYKRNLPNDPFVLRKQGSDNFFDVTGGIPGECIDIEVKVEAIETANCNTSTFTIQSQQCRCTKEEAMNGRTASNVKAYPVPASGFMHVSLLDEKHSKQANNENLESTDLKAIRQIIILDKLGNKKKVLNYPTNTQHITINTIDLPADVYFMEVSDGKNKVNLQVSVQK